MFCPNCGTQLPDDAVFCGVCGIKINDAAAPAAVSSGKSEPAETEQPTLPEGRKVTENIILGTDGKYHWYYEFKLMKNPSIIKVLWKIFFWIFVAMWAFLTLLDIIEGRFNMEDFLNLSTTFLVILAGSFLLVALGYFIYALIVGWKYCVMFEMDEDGVVHTQLPSQFKKSQVASAILIFMGAAAGKPGAMGTGILASAKSSMASRWSSVKSIEISRKHQLIKVNERLNKNQVYALPEDFEFVENFIKSHVSRKCDIRIK